jgi:hypothetical protein
VTLRTLGWTLGAWLVATALACLVVRSFFSVLPVDAARPHAVVASVWDEGKLVARVAVDRIGARDATLEAALTAHPQATRVDERVVAEGPVLRRPLAAFALSFVPSRDGVAATLKGRVEVLTVDDLLAHQAYDRGLQNPSIGLSAGLDVPLALALLAERFGVTAREVLEDARFRRVRMVRTVQSLASAPVVTADTLSKDTVRDAALAAGRYLARGVDAQGRLRYLVDAPTNQTLGGYDWPRHAGATYYLVQVAALRDPSGTADATVSDAALRAAGHMRDRAMLDCGSNRCIGSSQVVDVGSTALALIAFVEMARTKLSPEYALLVPGLAAFLRAQQRPDGELMHEYDRARGQPVDVQYLYYSGEAALALSRAGKLLADPRDVEAASRALAHLVGPAWSFFGNRYYFGEEHWTCLAMQDLWEHAPNQVALDFCRHWQAFGRALQYRPGETLYDADGAYGLGPIFTPRLTPTGSRTEAGLATLRIARMTGAPAAEVTALDHQTRRSLALLIRHQFGPGSASHLLADPTAVEGAMPASEVDWRLRIDYAQHAGCALLSWLNL